MFAQIRAFWVLSLPNFIDFGEYSRQTIERFLVDHGTSVDPTASIRDLTASFFKLTAAFRSPSLEHEVRPVAAHRAEETRRVGSRGEEQAQRPPSRRRRGAVQRTVQQHADGQGVRA